MAYTKIVLIAVFLFAALSLTEAQWGFQGSLSPDQANAGYSGSLGGYQSGYQGNYQGSQGSYQGYQTPQGSAGYQGNAYANQRY